VVVYVCKAHDDELSTIAIDDETFEDASSSGSRDALVELRRKIRDVESLVVACAEEPVRSRLAAETTSGLLIASVIELEETVGPLCVDTFASRELRRDFRFAGKQIREEVLTSMRVVQVGAKLKGAIDEGNLDEAIAIFVAEGSATDPEQARTQLQDLVPSGGSTVDAPPAGDGQECRVESDDENVAAKTLAECESMDHTVNAVSKLFIREKSEGGRIVSAGPNDGIDSDASDVDDDDVTYQKKKIQQQQLRNEQDSRLLQEKKHLLPRDDDHDHHHRGGTTTTTKKDNVISLYVALPELSDAELSAGGGAKLKDRAASKEGPPAAAGETTRRPPSSSPPRGDLHELHDIIKVWRKDKENELRHLVNDYWKDEEAPSPPGPARRYPSSNSSRSPPPGRPLPEKLELPTSESKTKPLPLPTSESKTKPLPFLGSKTSTAGRGPRAWFANVLNTVLRRRGDGEPGDGEPDDDDEPGNDEPDKPPPPPPPPPSPPRRSPRQTPLRVSWSRNNSPSTATQSPRAVFDARFRASWNLRQSSRKSPLRPPSTPTAPRNADSFSEEGKEVWRVSASTTTTTSLRGGAAATFRDSHAAPAPAPVSSDKKKKLKEEPIPRSSRWGNWRRRSRSTPPQPQQPQDRLTVL